jgi:anti-anti-sigma regulatory factor
MLRISVNEAGYELAIFELDGQVSGRWVELLRATCAAHFEKGVRVTIDLENVSFVDREGIALLRSLRDRRVEIRNALPFIAEQIKSAIP